LGLLFAYFSSPAWAADITVTSTDDLAQDDGKCTLREAITSANFNTPSRTTTGECAAGSSGTTDVINIGTSAVPRTGTVQLTSSLPTLSNNMEIRGPGADKFTVRRSNTAANFRIFTVISGSVVSISGITISGGNVPEDSGGGISNRGTLTVTNSTISGNSSASSGGGVLNFNGSTVIKFSTITKNSAPAGEGSGVALGPQR
jgi:CSLREA domain-containing protein